MSGDAQSEPMTWAAYIEWAVRRAGGVNELAARAHLHRATISAWRNGKKGPDATSVGSILSIAAAVGDDPRRALYAAGRSPGPDDVPATPTAAQADAPSLAAQLGRINARIDLITASALPFNEKALLIWEQQAEADRIVALYLDKPEDGGPARRRSA